MATSTILASTFLPSFSLPKRSFSSSSLMVDLKRSKLVTECSSRPQKKATAHHMKTRPKKTQPWDIKRRPTVYAPLPPLPPDWTLVEPGSDAESSVETVEAQKN